MKNQLDILVIGAGPGGYVAAIKAAQLGLKVAIAEKSALGGTCLNWGCIPTKALLRSAEIHHNILHAKAFGFEAKLKNIAWGDVINRSRHVAKQLSGGISHLMKKRKVEVHQGHARLLRKNDQGDFVIDINGKQVEAKKVILATGARPRPLAGFEATNDHIWSYKEAMVSEEQPNSLLVIGSGAIGVEFASFYNQLGTKVTIIEMQSKILPVEDDEISAAALKSFQNQGMRILTETTAELVNTSKNGLTVTLSQKNQNPKKETFDKVLVAIGVVPNTEDLGLDKLNVNTHQGRPIIDKHLQTNIEGLYAIGDIVGTPWLAHKASHEGMIAASHAAGRREHLHPLVKENVPGCTYTHPQIASIGLTEAAAQAAGHEIKVGRFPGIGNGKAIAMGDPSGFVKVIFDKKTGELLGAHMIGPEVTEQIQGLVIAKTLEATEDDLANTIFPHPTLSEMIHEAVLDADDKAIHM